MSDQIADRKIKLGKLRDLGVDPYGWKFDGVTPNADIRAAAEKLNIESAQILDADVEGATVRAAGRVVLHRDIGSLIFMTVRDRTGELQFALSKKMVKEGAGHGAQGAEEATEPRSHEATKGNVAAGAHACREAPEDPPNTGEFPEPDTIWKVAKLLDLGDIVGAEGRLGRTKTGELTLWCSKLKILSKCLRPPPEKRAGLSDVETRYRKRYVDLLSNPESQQVFIKRIAILEYIRQALRERGFLEVETPVLQPNYGGAAARPFTTHHNALDMKLYLRISPELHLKRLLVGGLERVFEFSRNFRNEGISPVHNPEFTMLELYQAYGDYHDMMEITEALVAGAAEAVVGSTKLPFGEIEIDYTRPWRRAKYADLFAEHVGFPLTNIAAVRQHVQELHEKGQLSRGQADLDNAVAINELFEHYCERHLINPTFVCDYPAPLCPLTRRKPGDPDTALRFECYVNKTEIANAYTELNDPAVQHETFSQQNRGEGDETMVVMDEDYVEALEYAMPPAGGLGIGIDRVIMLLTNRQSIRDVLLFPLQRVIRASPGNTIVLDSTVDIRKETDQDR
jgi:lysyl-tRNA synthetase class 2